MKSSKLVQGLFPFLLVAVGFTMACETPSRVSEHMGEAHRANKAMMIANPEAGTQPRDGVTDFEGVTVETTLKRYRSEQKRAPQKSLPTSILIQGGVSGSR